jgi:beta-glucosidase
MLVEKLMSESQAMIAAWLPGTSGGQGILNAITGDYSFRPNGSNDRRNTLSVDWPKTMVIFLFYIIGIIG